MKYRFRQFALIGAAMCVAAGRMPKPLRPHRQCALLAVRICKSSARV